MWLKLLCGRKHIKQEIISYRIHKDIITFCFHYLWQLYLLIYAFFAQKMCIKQIWRKDYISKTLAHMFEIKFLKDVSFYHLGLSIYCSLSLCTYLVDIFCHFVELIWSWHCVSLSRSVHLTSRRQEVTAHTTTRRERDQERET